MTDNRYAQKLRVMNLEKLFGETVFEKYVFLSCGANKVAALNDYKNTKCFWIEDKSSNADDGLTADLDSILLAHDHNTDYKGNAIRVKNWQEIYNLITG